MNICLSRLVFSALLASMAMNPLTTTSLYAYTSSAMELKTAAIINQAFFQQAALSSAMMDFRIHRFLRRPQPVHTRRELLKSLQPAPETALETEVPRRDALKVFAQAFIGITLRESRVAQTPPIQTPAVPQPAPAVQETAPTPEVTTTDSQTRTYIVGVLNRMADEREKLGKPQEEADLLRQMATRLIVIKLSPNIGLQVVFDMRNPKIWNLYINTEFFNALRSIPDTARRDIYIEAQLMKELGTLLIERQFPAWREYVQLLTNVIASYQQDPTLGAIVTEETYNDPRFQEAIYYWTAFWGRFEAYGYLFQAQFYKDKGWEVSDFAQLVNSAINITTPVNLPGIIDNQFGLIQNLYVIEDFLNSPQALWMATIFHIQSLWNSSLQEGAGRIDRNMHDHFFYGIQLEIRAGRASLQNNRLMLSTEAFVNILSYIRNRQYTHPDPAKVAARFAMPWSDKQILPSSGRAGGALLMSLIALQLELVPAWLLSTGLFLAAIRVAYEYRFSLEGSFKPRNLSLQSA